jgi:xanthine dehydrogenase YagR molybdenum-binding subunit
MLNLKRELVQDHSVGQPRDRVDGRLKVTGGARYSAEIPTTGVLYGVLVMSTVPSGTIRSMDTSAASREPGVRLIFTPFNAPRLPKLPKGGNNRVLSLLQDTTVYYNNQPIGLVVADSLEAAEYAADLVKVQYAQQKPKNLLDEERANAYTPQKANRESSTSLRGDPDSAYASAQTTIKNVYSTPMENHNPMEPHATIASWDATGSKLTVYDATQGVFGVQSTLAHIFQLEPANVRCVSYFIGGAFGCKGGVWSQVPLAVMASRQLKQPVKVVLSRAQMFGMVGYRPETEQTIALGADTTGKLVSIRHDVLTQTSTFDEFVEPSAVATRMLYSCPNVETSHQLVRLNRGTPTYMRAPGESSGSFAIETAIDEMAVKLGVDPLDFRLENYAEKDENENKPFSSKLLRQCYEDGAKRFGWDQRSATPRSKTTSDGWLIGYGVATATYPANRSQSSAKARYMADGSGYVLAGTQDIGTGTYTILGQIASDAMGIPVDKVRVEIGDTDFPQTPVSGGSMTAASTGSAVLEAGKAARQAVISGAIADSSSPLYGKTADGIDIKDGRIFLTGDTTVGEDVSALIRRQTLPYIEAKATSQSGPDAENYSKHSFGAVFTEVHVDPDLGMVRVNRVTGVYSVGKLLNAKTGRSQLIGGIVFGIGMALLEETLMDARSGRVVNADLAEYHLPVNRDVPVIDVSAVNEEDLIVSPLGGRGIGEIGITGIVASIGNAVYNATGTRVRSLPITLDKLLV